MPRKAHYGDVIKKIGWSAAEKFDRESRQRITA